jgi:hypothetical protein
MDDDELELLEQQREFMQSGRQAAAATVVRKPSSTQRGPSRFAQQAAAKKAQSIADQPQTPPIPPKPAEPTENVEDDTLSKVLSDVVEKNLSDQVFRPPVLSSSVAFPEPRHRSQAKVTYQRAKQSTPLVKTEKTKEQEAIVSQVEQTLKTSNKSTPEKPHVEVEVEVDKGVKISFNSLEEEKLKWTKDLATEKPDPESQTKLWRFDLSGELMGEDEPNDQYHSELYHHGKDPDKPGYTIEELLYLTRSSMPNQRTIAFTVLSRIVRNAKALKYTIPGE